MKKLPYFLLALMLLPVPATASEDFRCEVDPYSQQYDEWLGEMEGRLSFFLEPSVAGTQSDIDRVERLYSDLDLPGQGIKFVFTDTDFTALDIRQCKDGCTPANYVEALEACSAALGSRCIDAVLVIDGRAQCLLIPRPQP